MSMKLAVGQKVSYPGQGVCIVNSLQCKQIGDTSLEVYELRVLSDNSLILVPVNNAANVGIRPLISTSECQMLINILSKDFEAISSDWKIRAREFTAKIQSGDVFEAVDVLKKLSFLAHAKKLSFREQTLLEKSKMLIISEITNAANDSAEELNRKVDELIEIACQKHLRSHQPDISQAVH